MNNCHYSSWQINSSLILQFCKAEAALFLPLLGHVVVSSHNNQLAIFRHQLFEDMPSANIAGMYNNIAGIHLFQNTRVYVSMGVRQYTDCSAIHSHP